MRYVLYLLAFCLLGPTTVSAQIPIMPSTGASDAEATAEPSPNDIKELSRLLTDPTIIAWLQSRAQDVPVVDDDEQQRRLQAMVRANVAVVADRLHDVGAALATLPQTPGVVTATWETELQPNERVALLNLLLIFLLTGIGLEWLYWRYAVRLKRWAEVRYQGNLPTKTMAVLARVALTSLGVIVFIVGMLGTFVALDWPPDVEELVLQCLLFLVAVRVAAAFAMFYYAPHDDSLRLARLRRRSARMMTIGLVVVVGLLAGGSALSATSQLLGAGATAGLGVEIFSTLLATVVAIGLFWVIHLLTDAKMRSQSVIFAIAATLLFTAIFVTWLIGTTRLSLSILLLTLLVYFGGQLRHAIGSAFALAGDNDPDEQASREQMIGIYQPVAERLGRFAVITIGLLCLSWIWDIEPWDIDQNSTVADQIITIAVDVFVAWLIGDLIWTLTRTAIDRRMANMPKLAHGQTPGPEARMATLLPLFKKIVLVTVIAMIVLITLSSLGINIAPILAGAGVVGIALGFGAQALVRDIVSGVFFLIDDAFRVGEYIEMGELRGTVESISIRSLRVRHHRGAVHTIPFGELKSLTNYSRDWVMMKLEFRVPFETDLKLAKKIVKNIDAELRANPDYGQSFLQPLKFQGVRRMEEFNMVVGVKFMTKPGEQWTIRRDAYQRIRDEFDKAGIHFAQRNVKVEVIGGGEITEDVKQKAVGAAQDAIEEQIGAPKPA